MLYDDNKRIRKQNNGPNKGKFYGQFDYLSVNGKKVPGSKKGSKSTGYFEKRADAVKEKNELHQKHIKAFIRHFKPYGLYHECFPDYVRSLGSSSSKRTHDSDGGCRDSNGGSRRVKPRQH